MHKEIESYYQNWLSFRREVERAPITIEFFSMQKLKEPWHEKWLRSVNQFLNWKNFTHQQGRDFIIDLHQTAKKVIKKEDSYGTILIWEDEITDVQHTLMRFVGVTGSLNTTGFKNFAKLCKRNLNPIE